MKVLVITTSYPDFQGSTRGIFIRRLCRELATLGVEVVVLTPRIFSQSPLFEEETGIQVHRFRFPSSDTPLNQRETIPVFAMCIYMISGLFTALRLIRKEKPDIIHGNWVVPAGLIAAAAGTLTRTPVINTARGMDVRVSEKGLVKLLFGLAVKLSDKVTVVSEAMKDRESLSGAEIITSGVNEAFFRITPDRASLNILYTRSLEKVYDAETLIRAAPLVLSRMPGALFTVAGSGSQASALKDLAKGLGVAQHIRFVGSVQHAAVAELMGNASTYVSTAVADGTSIALLEAIASGLTPVATDIDANRSLITHGKDGYLFRPGDEQDLADKIILALTQGIPPHTLDNKRHDFKDMICWSSVAKRFIAGYHQISSKEGQTIAKAPSAQRR
jgi:L-malate glycosyltransferase